MAVKKPLALTSGNIQEMGSSDTIPGTLLGTIGISARLYNAGLSLVTGSAGYIEVPFGMTISGWTITGNTSGSIVVDVKKSDYSTFPTTSSIAGSEKPTLSSAQKNQDLTLSSWTTSVTAGDILEFYIDSVSGLTEAFLTIRGTKI